MADTTTAERATALSHVDLDLYACTNVDGSAGVRLAECRPGCRIALRGDPADRGFMAAAVQALDMVLPTDPNTSASGGSVAALWLGPDEWLLTTNEDQGPSLIGRLRDGLAGLAAAVVDVSDASTVIRLSGPSARDALAKGCPLDLHPSVFGPGRVAQSLVAQADVILHRIDAGEGGSGPVFDIHVRRSFAEYLWLWLTDAGKEFGVGVGRCPD